jgi:hypothetical protein
VKGNGWRGKGAINLITMITKTTITTNTTTTTIITLLVYIKSIYLCFMKSLSLKLDDEVFKETEKIIAKLDCARNRYINEALEIYNQYNRRKLLKEQLKKESLLTYDESLRILEEFEKIAGANEAI